MTQTEPRVSTLFTGARVAMLSVVWLAVAYLARSNFGIYYEALAALCTIPVLVLTYAYCLSHRSRGTAVLAIVATTIAVLVIGFAVILPKGSAA